MNLIPSSRNNNKKNIVYIQKWLCDFSMKYSKSFNIHLIPSSRNNKKNNKEQLEMIVKFVSEIL